MRRTSLHTLPLALRSTVAGSSTLRTSATVYGSMFTSRGLSTAPSAATKLKPDQPHPSWTDYGQLLNNFLEKMVHKERLGFKWWVRPNPSGQQASSDNYHLWFDEEKFPEGKTVVAMASYAPGKVERTLTINWKTWELIIKQEDLVDGALSTSRTIQIPPDWLLAMKKVRWPLPEEAKKNAQESVPTTLPTIRGKDLYELAKHKTKDEQELTYLKEKLMAVRI